jgi:hypothetical protein
MMSYTDAALNNLGGPEKPCKQGNDRGFCWTQFPPHPPTSPPTSMSCPTARGANTFAVALECTRLVGLIDVAIAGAKESITEMDSWGRACSGRTAL